MHHTAALIASLASLALICAIYYCNRRAAETSWLKSDVLASVLLSLLVGLFPIALFAPFVGLWQLLQGGLSAGSAMTASGDILSLGACVLTAWLFRALVRARADSWRSPTNVTPLTPRPAGPATPTHSRLKKAA